MINYIRNQTRRVYITDNIISIKNYNSTMRVSMKYTCRYNTIIITKDFPFIEIFNNCHFTYVR